MAFTIEQMPSLLTPAHAEHIWTINSEYSGYSNYKYVINIIAFPYDWVDSEVYVIAKIKARPNSEGRLIIDVQKIIQSMLDPNIRVDWDNYLETDIKMYRGMIPQGGDTGEDSYYVSKPTLSEAFSRVNANNSSEEWGPFEAVIGNEPKYQMLEYRLMCGEEYYDDNGYFVVNGPGTTGAKFVPEVDASVSTIQTGTYPVTNPGIKWSNFNGRYNQSIANQKGVRIVWKDSGGSIISDNSIPIATSQSYETSTEPDQGDVLEVSSIYSQRTWKFVWDNEGIGVGWTLVDVFYVYPYTYGQFQPRAVLTWVGAQDRLQESRWFGQVGNVNNINGHLYDPLRWHMHNKQSDTARSPYLGQFLNIAGPSEDIDYGQGETIPTRKRTIYRGEPLMVSFFNGFCRSFLNDLRCLVVRYKKKNQPAGTFSWDVEYMIENHGAGPLVNPDDTYPTYSEQHNINNLLLHFTKNDIWPQFDSNNPIEWIEVYTWQYYDDPENENPENIDESASEILRYDVKDVNCFTNPTYFVFLNRNGGWDTFTFGAKTVKSYDIDRKTYTKSPYKNSSIYNKQSYDQAKVVYDTNIEVGLTCESDYLKEQDSVIVEDLIRSSSVYIVEDIYVPNATTTVEPKLIPVTVKTSSVEEYEKRFEKLFQHTIEVEFNNIKGYNQSM